MTTTVLPSGIPHLTTLLGGDLLPHALVLIAGEPGAGKTVLASQILFTIANAEMPAILLTTQSEGPTKYLEHVRGFRFFDEALLGKYVHLYALDSLLGDDITTTIGNLTRIIRQHQARVLFIDGIQGLEDTSFKSNIRLLLSMLSTRGSYLNAMTLVTLTGKAHGPIIEQEMTVADVGIGLAFGRLGNEHVRTIEIMKQRGRGQLPGLHTYKITGDGIDIAPRLETLPPPSRVAAPAKERFPFGLPELDTLLHGGPNALTTTTLAGAPGTGKTVLGLQWALENATVDEPAIFATFAEYPEQLSQKATAFGMEYEAAIASKTLHILPFHHQPLNPDHIATTLLNEITTHRPRVIVIDDIRMLLRALGDRGFSYLAALRQQFYYRGLTSLFTYEIEPLTGLRLDLSNSAIGNVAENLIVTQQFMVGSVLRRMLAVVRMRLSDHDRSLRELLLEPNNIQVLTIAETAPDVLNQAAVVSGGISPLQ